ncbi:hypothetical protein VPH35_061149 [Triticum aestivum]
MGAAASHSSPADEMPLHVSISGYSNLVRVPLPRPETLKPTGFNEGLADGLYVSVDLHSRFRYKPDLVLEGIDISMEVLDETGENTVFHRESSGMLESWRFLNLFLSRRELEASSCVHDDSFTVRCTLAKQRSTKWWRLISKPDELAVLEPQVTMAGSNMITIGGFSKLKAALWGGECTYSTHFALGGCRWYFQFCPNGNGIIGLVRVTFSFELEGMVNFESEKMTHTFNHANAKNRYLYRYRCRLEPSTSAMDDRLIVRCRLAVIVAEKPSLPPDVIRTATTPCTESMLTPLLSAMHD